MKRIQVCVPVFCAFALAVGCSRKTADSVATTVEEDLANPDVMFDESPMYDLFGKVDGILTSGRTNEATRVFAEALEDEAFAPFHQQMFSTFLRYLLFTEQVEEAKARFLGALRTAPDDAMPSQDLIYGYLLDNGDGDAALDWARTLMAQDLPLRIRAAATEWVASGCLAAGNGDGALEAINTAIADFPADVAAPMAQRFAQNALSRKNVAMAEGIVEAMVARSSDPEFQKVAQALKLRIFAAKEDFASAVAAIPALADVLPDSSFSQGITELFRAAEAAGNSEAIDKIAETVVLDGKFAALPLTRLNAARKWIAFVVDGDADKIALYPERFTKLMQMNLPPSQLCSIFSRNFYKIIDIPAVLREMASICKVLREQVVEKGDAETLKSYALDAAFILENYDEALAVIDGGVADRDDSWHSMTRAKILAHKALAEGRAADAVANFRKFMDLLPDEEQHDPTSGISFSRDTIVANNEKRIGDIWTKAGEPEKAAAAYAAAREAYVRAIEGNTFGDETGAYIKAQMDALDAVYPPEGAKAAAETKAEAEKTESAAEAVPAPAAETAAPAAAENTEAAQ